MTDKELLELAAKAAGIASFVSGTTGLRVAPAGRKSGYIWNPLTSDADALRLAVALRYQGELSVHITDAGTVAECVDLEAQAYEKHGDDPEDPYAATRRAIVRAAAEIGKSKKIDPLRKESKQHE